MCVSSDSDTVHIFKLGANDKQQGQERNGKSGLGMYLPNYLSSMWEPQRDFAHLKLPSSGEHNICAMSNTTAQVMVVTESGYVYVYDIPAEGGECQLCKTHTLLGISESGAA